MHRIGQQKTVFVTSLLAKDTVEERIYELSRKKGELFRKVIDDMSDTGLSNVLSEEELFSIFGLRKQQKKTITVNSREEISHDCQTYSKAV